MMSKVRAIAAAAACVYAIASSAQAQEQTPENAQKFIGQIAGLGQLSYSWRHDEDSFDQSFWLDLSTVPNGVRRYFKKVTAPIWEVRAESRCLTTFRFKDTYELDGRVQTGDATKRLYWSEIAKVETTGNLVYVTPGASIISMRFTLPNEALAKRMGYAMEFLRVSCDATQGTGF